MIKRKLKPCKNCEKETYIFSKGLCRACSIRNVKKKSISKIPNAIPKRSKAISVGKKKPSGELSLFNEIWSERSHACQICSKPLYTFDVWNFAHVLSKGSFGRFRLLKENIVLMCREHHTQYDCGSTINDFKFKWILELKEKLKQEYYENNN